VLVAFVIVSVTGFPLTFVLMTMVAFMSKLLSVSAFMLVGMLIFMGPFMPVAALVTPPLVSGHVHVLVPTL